MTTQPKYSDLFPSRFMKASDLYPDADNVMTITALAPETMRGQDGQDTVKFVLRFEESDKSLVLNKTNAEAIYQLYGETSNWPGKRISLYVTEVAFAGKVTDGIRIRRRAPQAAPPPPDVPDALVFQDQR